MISENTKPTPIRPKPPYRVGLIGVTGYAHDYFRSLNALVAQGRIVWGAVTIINPDEAKEQIAILDALGVPIYQDYQLMLESEKCALDWVCIPTGIGSHTRMTIDSLNLGLQVLVEKPLAPTLQDVAAIQAAERASGVSVAVGFQHKSYWRAVYRLVKIRNPAVRADVGKLLALEQEYSQLEGSISHQKALFPVKLIAHFSVKQATANSALTLVF